MISLSLGVTWMTRNPGPARMILSDRMIGSPDPSGHNLTWQSHPRCTAASDYRTVQYRRTVSVPAAGGSDRFRRRAARAGGTVMIQGLPSSGVPVNTRQLAWQFNLGPLAVMIGSDPSLLSRLLGSR
eukprot:758311-Hanusia_phi.AAC.4